VAEGEHSHEEQHDGYRYENFPGLDAHDAFVAEPVALVKSGR
jgi:hypothetical protein